MFIARIIGEVVSTIKHPSLSGRKLLVVEKLTERGKPTGDSQLAVDSVDLSVHEVHGGSAYESCNKAVCGIVIKIDWSRDLSGA